MFDNFVLSTFAKNDPLIIKTSGGVIIWGDPFYQGEGISGTVIGHKRKKQKVCH